MERGARLWRQAVSSIVRSTKPTAPRATTQVRITTLFTFCLVLFPAGAMAEKDTTLWQGGQAQVDFDLLYARGRSRSIDARLPLLRSDVVRSSVGLRYGLSDRIQLSVTLPYIAATSTWDDRWMSELGDIKGQLDLRLWGDGVDSTALVLAVGGTAPTGDDAVGGTGWRGFVGLRALRRLDPLLFFGEIAYLHTFEEKVLGVRLSPGPTLQAQGGLGLRIDESRILWLKAAHAYQWATRRHGETLPGSDRLESTLRLALTWAIRADLLLEVSTTAGLSRDAPDVVLGLALTYTFQARR